MGGMVDQGREADSLFGWLWTRTFAFRIRGMGSLNDVVLQRSNGGAGVLLDVCDKGLFDKRRSEIYDLARGLRTGKSK